MENPYYFAEDGSWGIADDLVIIDSAMVDGHLFEVLEGCYDSERSEFVKWFSKNDHAPVPTDNLQGMSNGQCGVCDEWDS